LIPLRIEDVPLGKTLEYFISSEHWMDALSRPLEPHVDRLADAIRALLARPSKSAPLLHTARPESGASPHPPATAPASASSAATEPASPPAVPAPLPAARPPGKLRPMQLGVAAAVILGILVALGVFKASPPQLLSVQFPGRIWANATRASGVIFFRTKKSDVASCRFDVVTATSFPPISFSVQDVAGRREGSFGFYLQTGTPQRITLKAVITDRAGHDSNPVPFSFEAVAEPVAPVAPPPAVAPPYRGRRSPAPNFRFRVR
jgi:hypothetical protein